MSKEEAVVVLRTKLKVVKQGACKISLDHLCGALKQIQL